jgi:hypothetical protein
MHPAELYEFKQVVDFLLDHTFARSLTARFHAQSECDIVEYGHVAEEGVMLEDETDLAFAHMLARCIFAFEQYLSVGRRVQARDDAQQRGLAATRRAQQGNQFTAGKLKRNVV